MSRKWLINKPILIPKIKELTGKKEDVCTSNSKDKVACGLYYKKEISQAS